MNLCLWSGSHGKATEVKISIKCHTMTLVSLIPAIGVFWTCQSCEDDLVSPGHWASSSPVSVELEPGASWLQLLPLCCRCSVSSCGTSVMFGVYLDGRIAAKEAAHSFTGWSNNCSCPHPPPSCRCWRPFLGLKIGLGMARGDIQRFSI